MAEINWTDDQLLAIETTDRGVVVSAAAGSGKTAVLIERTIRILADRSKGVTADKLLAVTFTVDATVQMREKLGEAFEKRLAEETDPQQKKWLNKQQDLLETAKINTINAFCLDLVKSNLHEFDLRDGLKIIDENDATVILNQSVSQAMDRLAEQSKADFELLVDCLSDNDESKVEERVKELYVFLRSLPFPQRWIDRCRAGFTDEEKLSGFIQVACYDFREKCEKALKYVEMAKARYYRLNEQFNVGDSMGVMLNSDEEVIKDLLRAIDDGNWEKISAKTENYGWVKASYPSKKNFKEMDWGRISEASESIKNIRDKKYKKIMDSISKSIGEIGKNIREDLKTAQRVFEILCRLSLEAEKISMEEKCRRNAVEFSDVERMAIQLLVKDENGVPVRTELAEEIVKNGDYRVILIDEFQDVNNLQELIFKALSDTDSLEIMGKNVFVVGDVKQSIYRFRQSNPLLFIDAKKKAGEAGNSDRLKLVELKSNYRSRKNVIDFVNLLFENIMSEEVGELTYEGGERLCCGAKYLGKNHDTEIMLIVPQEQCDDEADDEGEDEESRSVYYAENVAVARKIRQMIDEGAEVYDGAGKPSRPCRPSDFCVLCRSSNAVDSMPSALEMFGLKAYSEDSSGYLRSREISVMINLLRVIDNPMQDIPLVSVMLSPIMGFTADETAVLRNLCRTKSGYINHIFQIINSASKSESERHEREADKISLGSRELEEKCRQANELISRLRFYASGMTLSRLIRRIYDETGFFAVASAYENTKQKRANLRMFLEYASSYEKGSGGGITGFLRYIDSVSESGKDFKQAVTVTESSDSVIIRTIHRSKGLEYPFVFLCGTGKRFNESDLQGSMLLDEQMGVGFTLLNHEKLSKTETIGHRALKVVSRNKMLSEEVRLLYVALTRAKEKIFIPIALNQTKSPAYNTKKIVGEIAQDISLAGGINSRIIRGLNSYQKWLFALLLCCPNNEAFLKLMEVECELPQLKTDAEITFTVSRGGEVETEQQPEFYTGKVNEEKCAELVKRYRRSHEANSVHIPSKLTVTELVREEKEKSLGEKNPEFYPQLPRLSEQLGKLTSAQRGTYTHLFMELADYEKASTDTAGELRRLEAEGFFTEKEAKGVYLDALKRFFAGDFYRRMSASSEIIREKQFLVSFSDLKLGDKYGEYIKSGSMLQGVADCIFKEDDGYVLVDYKTDNFSDISELGKYGTQLELYKSALDILLDKPIKACYIYSFKLGEGLEIGLV